MTRGTIAIKDLVTNGGTIGAAATINNTNGCIVQTAGNTRKLIVLVKNTGTALPGTVTIKAGVNPPAWRQGLGDATVVVPVSSERLIVIESARFAQADGSIWLDFSASLNNETAYAYHMPSDV